MDLGNGQWIASHLTFLLSGFSMSRIGENCFDLIDLIYLHGLSAGLDYQSGENLDLTASGLRCYEYCCEYQT